MTESLRSQLANAESLLRDSESRLAAFNGMREELRRLVGHAESDGGLIIAEWSAADGLVALDLDPKAMRMASADLAATIRATIRAAIADLSTRTQDAIRGAGGLPEGGTTSEQLRERLIEVREQFVETGRAAADGLDRAQDHLNRVRRG